MSILDASSDDWVYVEEIEDYTRYYKSSSVIINNHKKIIKVWAQHKHIERGEIDLLENSDSIEKPEITEIGCLLVLHLLDFNNWKYSIKHVICYSKIGDVLFDYEYSPKWQNIETGFPAILLNQLLEDFNIQR